MSMRGLIIVLLGSLFAMLVTHAGAQPLPLNGQWRFALDKADAGVTEKWFEKDLADSVRLPGSLQEQSVGEAPSADTKWTSGIGMKLLGQEKYAPYRQAGQFKTPFWLTPLRYYVGAAWYQRDIVIPETFAGRRVTLFLERPHWETAVWVDGQQIGTQNALGVAHEYDITAAARPGRHRLTIRVDNRVKVPVGNDAHSVSDQTQGNWNGIVGKIELRAGGKQWLDDVQVYPDVAGRKVKVVVQIGNISDPLGKGILTLTASSHNSPVAHAVAAKSVPVQWEGEKATVECEYELGPDAQLWDEFSPALYQLRLELKAGMGEVADTRVVTFGMRQLAVDGTQFAINGRRIFLRGTLECCIFPLTGYPPTDVDSWKRILRIAKAHGLNHLRFHSWCPPEAAFVAADEMGVYYQVECSCWATFGDGTPLDRWIYEESERMVKAYGNHPSFLLMVPTNEPGGKNRERFLGNWVKYWSGKDARRRYSAGSGWPSIAENNYHVTPTPRIQVTRELQRNPQTASDYRDFVSKQKVPVLSHEIAQWCVYPNFDEIRKYTGSPQAGNLEIFRDFLNKSGMGKQAHDFLMASGKFQAAIYKEEIEAALRTPGMGGFQLLDLHDFPGQGTAPVGVLDAFWDSKGYITPEQYHRFCCQTVPLARMTSRTFTSDQSLEAQIDIAHYGPKPLLNNKVSWQLRNGGGKRIAGGTLEPGTIQTGGLTSAGKISVPLNSFTKPAKLNLEVAIDGMPYANDWDLWVYPATIDTTTPPRVTIARKLDEQAIGQLSSGGTVLLLPGPGRIAGDTFGTFRPIFWNRITFPGQREHTLGVLCDPGHPALAGFPTNTHSNWQWWDLQDHCKPMVLDGLPKDLKPIVQMIDDWDVCRRLALAFEARVGRGKLIVCSIDLEKDLEHRPVAKQFLRSLLDYMTSPFFEPSTEVSLEQIRPLLKDLDLMARLGARITHVDNEHADYPAANVLDGNPATFWHTQYGAGTPDYPHELTITLNAATRVAGLGVLPRQDIHNGVPRQYVVQVSEDGSTWREAAKGSFEDNQAEKTITFASPQLAKAIKFIAVSGHRNDRFTAIAEIRVIQ